MLDVIAIAGGSSNPSLDSIVKINRADQAAEAPLSAIEPGSSDDIQLLPQDRVSITFRPRTFTVLGATGKVAEIPFQSPRVSLVEAIGRSGGPSDERADPAAIYVFRYEPAEYDGSPAEGSRPVAYRLNMRRPESYFLAQRFEMRPPRRDLHSECWRQHPDQGDPGLEPVLLALLHGKGTQPVMLGRLDLALPLMWSASGLQVCAPACPAVKGG